MSVSSIHGGGTYSDDYPAYRAHEAEQEAETRVKTAQDLIQKTEVEESTAIDHLRDRFEKTYELQNSKHTELLEDQKMKGYEQIRDLQRAQQAELYRTIREGQNYQEKTEQETRAAVRKIDTASQTQLNEVLNERTNRIDFEKVKSEDELQAIQLQAQNSINKIRENSQQRVQTIDQENRESIQQLKENRQENQAKAQIKNESFLKKTLREQREGLDHIYENATQKLSEIRKDTAQKIAAYSSRQSDPFYKLVSLDAELKDEGHEFVLSANIPEYEQEHISVNIRGNQLVLSGYRQNEELLKEDSGHRQGTSSYQSFHESFPLNWPVDAKRLTREKSGDQVIIRVPKLNEFAPKSREEPKPQPGRLQVPNFPHNIRKST